MAKMKKPALKANKITPLEGITTEKVEVKIETPKNQKKTTKKEKAGPKKKNGDNWKKCMIQMDPATKKLMLKHIAASDTLTTQSIFIDQAIKHFSKHLES